MTLKGFDTTVYEDKVRVRVSLCIRSSDTVSICFVCMLKPVPLLPNHYTRHNDTDEICLMLLAAFIFVLGRNIPHS